MWTYPRDHGRSTHEATEEHDAVYAHGITLGGTERQDPRQAAVRSKRSRAWRKRTLPQRTAKRVADLLLGIQDDTNSYRRIYLYGAAASVGNTIKVAGEDCVVTAVRGDVATVFLRRGAK